MPPSLTRSRSNLRLSSSTPQLKRNDSITSTRPTSSVPDLKRHASETRLHPLTQQQNQRAAKSVGALKSREAEVAASIGCQCKLCRNPLGQWRHDQIDDEVSAALQLACKKDVVEPQSPTPSVRSPQKKNLIQMYRERREEGQSPRIGFGFEADESPTRRARPASATSSAGSMAKRTPKARERLSSVASLLDEMFLHRPCSAKVREIRRRTPDDRKRRQQEAAERCMQQKLAFVERCRLAWSAKAASMEEKRLAKEAKVFERKASLGWLRPASPLNQPTDGPEMFSSKWLALVIAVHGFESFYQLRKEAKEKRLEEEEIHDDQAAPKDEPEVTPVESPTEPVDSTKISAWERWRFMLAVACAIVRMQRNRKRHRAATVILTVTPLLLAHVNFFHEIKLRLYFIKYIQRSVRRNRLRGEGRHMIIRRMLERTELELLRRHWADEDVAIIKRERKRLQGIRAAKERKNCELMIATSKENYRRCHNPKTDADRAHIQRLLARHGLPSRLWYRCTDHVVETRKELLRRELDDRTRGHEAYLRALQTWQDIENVIQLMDPSGHNPAPRPEPPTKRYIPNTLDHGLIPVIVKKVQHWYEEHVSSVNSKLDTDLRDGIVPLPDILDEKLATLVRTAVLARDAHASYSKRSK